MISNRLKTLVNLCLEYEQGMPIYDIGCDHCLVGQELLQSEGEREIHCVDRASKALGKAEERLNNLYSDIPGGFSFGSSTLQIVINSGEKLLLQKKSLILIAGIGGMNMVNIVKHLHSQNPNHTYILSAHKNIIEVKRELKKLDQRFFVERALQESGKFYEIFVCSTSAKHKIHEYGSLMWQFSESRPYYEHLLNHYTKFEDKHQNKLIVEYLRESSPPKPI